MERGVPLGYLRHVSTKASKYIDKYLQIKQIENMKNIETLDNTQMQIYLKRGLK